MTKSQIVNQTFTWHDYAVVKNWKKGLKQASDNHELSDGSEKGIIRWFPRFLESTKSPENPDGINPNDLIEEAINDPQIIKDRLSDCFDWCKKNVKGTDPDSLHDSIVIGVYGVIRGFYSHNMPAMPKIRSPKLKPRRVEKTDSNYPLTIIVENSDGTKSVEIDREQYKEFLSKLELRDQTAVLCMLSSSLDSGDLMKLTMNMVRSQSQHERIFINDYRSKTGEIINTFFSKEATQFLRNYVQKERRNASNDEQIFVTGMKNRRAEFRKIYGRGYTNDDWELLPKAKPLHRSQLAVNLRVGAMKMGIPLESGIQSPFRPKKNRKLFSDACDRAGIGENKRKIFMGKSDKSDKVYAGKARHELEIYYEMVESFVTIYSEPKDIQSEIRIKELEEELEKTKLSQVSEFERFRNEMNQKMDLQRQQFDYFIQQQEKLKKKK